MNAMDENANESERDAEVNGAERADTLVLLGEKILSKVTGACEGRKSA